MCIYGLIFRVGYKSCREHYGCLHETNLRVGPPMLEGCSLGDSESLYPFSPKFQVATHLSDFEDKKDISSPFLACASPIMIISMDTPRMF